MAQFQQWFNQDFTHKIEIRHCDSVMFTGDNAGAVVGVYLFNNGAVYSSGGTVTGAVKRSDGGVVALTGTLSGNAASVVIPQAALAYAGPIGVRIVLTQGGQTATVLKAIYTVDDNTGTPVDPGTIIPSINDLISAIESAVASVPSDYSDLLHTLAPDFSASTAYAAGEYVWYDGVLYKLTVDHPAGSWTGADAIAAVIGDEINGVMHTLGEKTRNLIAGEIKNAVINASGSMISYAGYNMYFAPVTQGKKYTYTTNDEARLHGFFANIPAIGSTTYNNSRYTSAGTAPVIIEAPITGYIAVRTNGNYNIMIEEGMGATNYVPPITAKDSIARESAAENADQISANALASGILINEDYTSDMAFYDDYPYYTCGNVSGGTYVRGIDIYGQVSTKYPAILFLKDTNGQLSIVKRFSLNSVKVGWNYTELNYHCVDDCIIALNWFAYKPVHGTNVPKVISASGYTINSVTDGARQLQYAVKLCAAPLCEPVSYASVSMFETGCVCGDSYAAGMVGLQNPDRLVTHESMSWGKVLGRKYGISVLVCAKGGVTTKQYLTDSDCLPKLLSNDAKQFYAISLGHNDMYVTDHNNYTPAQISAYIGSVSDLVGDYSSYPDTLIGNYAKIIEQIRAKAPTAFIVLLRQSRPYASFNGGAEINNAISALGQHYSIPVFDPECDPLLGSEAWVALMTRNHPLFPGYSGLAESFARLFSAYYQEYKSYYNAFGTN